MDVFVKYSGVDVLKCLHDINILQQTRSMAPLQSISFLLSSDLYGCCRGALLIGLATHGRLPDVKFLVNNGADIDMFCRLSLHNAAMNGHDAIVRFLVENGSNIHSSRNKALVNAARYGHESIVKYLVEKGADVKARKCFPLSTAADNGHESIVRFLVDSGSDVRADNDFPLLMASLSGHETIVRFLLDGGSRNPTAFNAARSHGRWNIVRLFVEKGAHNFFESHHCPYKNVRHIRSIPKHQRRQVHRRYHRGRSYAYDSYAGIDNVIL